MKRKIWKGSGLLFGLVVACAATAFARTPGELGPIPQDLDSATRFDANAIDMFTTNFGSFSYDIGTGNPGLIYPKGSQNTALFASGLWVGAKVDGKTRVTVAEYSFEYVPGRIEADGTYDDSYSNNPRWRTYKIDGDSGPGDEDWDEWPFDDGAPADSLGNPKLIGDQTLWSVFHDADPDAHGNDAGRTAPLGMEVQQTIFGFNLKGPLENVVFAKYLFTNKSQDTWEDTYVSLWSDPDLGGAGDDYVGCDTTLSIGYTYNATNTDNQYGSNPPAIAFDFLQGPIVPSVGDTAYVSGVPVPDYKNLPMVSFNKYINGTDPSSFTDSYNYMKGLNPDGSVVVNPVTNLETKFQVPGDPTNLQNGGWLDSNPADRRMMLSAGPFTVAPGETQEVVCAIVLGQGSDRLTSITAMKFNDSFAQAAFDVNFDLPKPPPPPEVSSAGLDGTISLHWTNKSEVEYDEPGYAFEGYNVYQLAAPDLNAEAKLIATLDVVNNVATIFDDQFDIEAGVVINRPVQFGTDRGVERSMALSQDAVIGQGLRNATEYYYNITAYSYNQDAAGGLKALESAFQPITVVPQSPMGGVRYEDGDIGDVLDVAHSSGDSDGGVAATLVDPTLIKEGSYEVTFEGQDDNATWSLSANGTELRSGETNFSGDNNYPIVDGIIWRVFNNPGFTRNSNDVIVIDEVKGPGGTDVAADGTGGPGRNVFHTDNSTSEWFITAGGGSGLESRIARSEGGLFGHDIVVKWDYDPANVGIWIFNGEEIGTIPYSVWSRDPNPPFAETRIIPGFYTGGADNGTPGVYAVIDTTEGNMDGFSGRPITDWGYAWTGDYDAFAADVADGVLDDQDLLHDEVFARFCVASESFTLPAQGTEIVLRANRFFDDGDVYTVETKGGVFSDSNLKADLSEVKVVPNPYRNQSTYELNQFNRIVRFTHLPDQCRVRIFTIAGDLVRTLEKEADGTSILEWNLQSERSIPVASGVYMYHIDALDGDRSMGETTGKLVVFMEKERLNFF